MALIGLLAVIAIKALVANGFGFQVAPMQMEIQLPAGGPGPFQGMVGPPGLGSPFGGLPSSLMSMMSFPPVFNPMEAMGREELGGDARMDVNGPMGNVTTRNKTENKDGFKVTTITSDGPGFHSYIKEYEKEGNASSNATSGKEPAGPPPGLANLLSPGRIFDIMNQLKNMKEKPKKCKKCGSGKFCDPIFHLCRKKFAEGRTCMAQKQCGANLRCQWGKCQKAKKGDPGTFCKGNGQCNGDSCCRNTPGSFHLMCIPPQQEGAICGLHERQESVAKLFYVVKRSTVATCSPCKSGLKCANTGGSRFKRCAKDNYVEKAAEELEDDNPSNAITDDEDEKDDKEDKDDNKDDNKDEDKDEGSNHPLADPNVPDRDDKPTPPDANNEDGDKEDEDEEEEEEGDKEEDKKDKEDKKESNDEEDEEKDDKKEEKEDDEKDDDDDDKDEKDKDDDKDENDDKEEGKEENKDVKDKDDKKDKKKPPVENGDGIDILVPKKKKKKSKSGKGKGKGKGKKD